MRRPRHTSSPEGRRKAEVAGRRGERVAAWWLRLKGWRILATRCRTRVGEVDIVARRGRMVAFVEVKARGSEAELALAIDVRRLARVAAAADLLRHRYARAGEDVRIDVMLVAPRRLPRHLVNVWHG
jgi:putative endonuclease